MRLFAHLIDSLDQSNKTRDKVAALAHYFRQEEASERLFGLALLLGRRNRRTVNTTLMRLWAAEQAGIPLWLFEETYHTVGDLAETIALLIPEGEALAEQRTLSYYLKGIAALDKAEEADKHYFVTQCWQHLDRTSRFVFNKMITGGFRIGVSQGLVQKALALVTSLSEESLAHRLMAGWEAETHTWDQLFAENAGTVEPSQPYPFLLAHPIEDLENELGPTPSGWQLEWKWDGIRGQLIRRMGETFLWSRGVELMSGRFPELESSAEGLPDGTVLDGEIICLDSDYKPLPFNHLQTRIGRLKPGAKLLKEHPVFFIAYDLMEAQSQDLREWPLAQRRQHLESLLAQQAPDSRLRLSQTIPAESWEQVAQLRLAAREEKAEGLMLKRLDSLYAVGRKRGLWWKWKLEPLSIDAVMIYAQKGHGRRADLYTDFTFAVWDGDRLVPFTKAYSGLTDKEMAQVDAFVKKNTLERFGPVRSVKAELVFEIGFEGIQESTRHKSGIALRFPRILRWRTDKTADQADTLESLQALLARYGK